MVFGDVNLSENPIREAADGTPLNPGAGGWPTVRYFNKATGVGGAAYVKKTDKAMCDELKDVDNMITAVEEAASTSVCSVADGAGCSDKEKDYIAKWNLVRETSAGFWISSNNSNSKLSKNIACLTTEDFTKRKVRILDPPPEYAGRCERP